MLITLIDRNEKMTEAWKKEFPAFENIKIYNDDIFKIPADALVSPANSFGIMDGGIDGKIRDFFGTEIEKNVQRQIRELYYGELPVGNAILTSTGIHFIRYLITAPTMRVPAVVKSTLNAYLAMRAVMVLLKKTPEIQSVSIPGLCALTGAMPYNVVARQMRVAYEKVFLGALNYSHWRDERYLEDYLMCRTDAVS